MFEFVQNNKIIIRIILGAIALTFIGFGVSSFSTVGDDPYIAKVGSSKIYQQELNQALDGQPSYAANQQAVLDSLIHRELLLLDAHHAGLVVLTAQLQHAIATIPEFQENDKFDDKRYLEFLKSRHMTAEMFQSRLGRDILLQERVAPFLQSQIVARTVTDHVANVLGETCQVSALVLKPQAFANDIKTEDKVLKTYYDAHQQRFKLPESVKLDYVVLSQQQLADHMPVKDIEISNYYDQHKAEFNTEERRASHILLTVPQEAAPEVKAKIKAQAEEILNKVRGQPEKFAQLAQQYSQDPGSAAAGGDLGFFSRGLMVKPFSDAAFSMKVGQISGLVSSQFGYHIIKLDAIKTVDYATIKPQLLKLVQRQKAVAQFREAADQLNELAYQHSDSLNAVQQKLALPVQQSGWLSRDMVAPGSSLLTNPKVLDAAFSDEVLQKKHNSEPLDVGNNTLVVIRLASHQKERIPAFDEVKERIKADILLSEGAKLAEKRGQTLLASLKEGQTIAGEWSATKTVSRRDLSGLPLADVRAIFALDSAKMPGFTGAKQADGSYTVYRVEKRMVAPAISAADHAQLSELLAQMSANAQMTSYLQLLYQKYPVTVRHQPLERS